MRRLLDRILSLGGFLGAMTVVTTLVLLALGVRPVFLVSGSMSPTMPTGSLALAEEVPGSQLRVGDVVCVTAASGSRVTHRIAAIEQDGGIAVLSLKGDANTVVDPETYRVSSAYRVIGHVAGLGYVAGAAQTPLGLFVLGCLVMGLLVLLSRGDRGQGPGDGPPPPRRRRDRPARRPAVVAGGIALAVLGPGQVAGAWASPWTDGIAIGGTTLTAGTIAAPATFTCGGLGLLSVQFNWAAVAGATSYTLHYGAGGASTTTIAGTSATLTAAIAGGTAWVQANRDFGSTTWTSVASTTRTYTVAVVSLCS